VALLLLPACCPTLLLLLKPRFNNMAGCVCDGVCDGGRYRAL